MHTQMKHVSARLADRSDEAEDGPADSLWRNDGSGSESCSMSFTQPVLRESRVIKDTGCFGRF